MRLEIKFNQSCPIVNHRYAQLIPKKTDLQKKNPETQKSIENSRSRGKTQGLAPLAKSFWKYQRRNAIYRTGQCDLILFSKNAIQNNAIKQYLEIVADWPQCLSSPIMLQTSLKYFNFQITSVKCKSIHLKTFA